LNGILESYSPGGLVRIPLESDPIPQECDVSLHKREREREREREIGKLYQEN